MYECSFVLNDKPISLFKIGAFSAPAFSGSGQQVNRRSSACFAGAGPIPPGSYYIFDRQSGGRLEWFWKLVNDHSEWFALYAIDERVDDETFCNRIRRGHFRLHP